MYNLFVNLLYHSYQCNRYCPEVYIGDKGHHIKSCYGFKRIKKNEEHKWINATVMDILSPVEAFHLRTMFQPTIRHEQRFDFDRIPAVVELCSQAGAEVSEEILYNHKQILNSVIDRDQTVDDNGRLDGFEGRLAQVGQLTLDAWERLRLGVKKLLLVYPAKVCEHCSEVHIGPSGHKARVCGIFRYEGWRGGHKWKKAEVDDLVPPKIVWHRRPQDPDVLVDTGRGFYGHAPAVVELCMQAGARVPKNYFTMMKLHGLPPKIVEEQGVTVKQSLSDDKTA